MQEAFIRAVEGEELLANRFSEIKCVNVSQAGDKQGAFSLIFSAVDTIELKSSNVCIKFFDPDKTNDIYRLNCFNRESDLLSRVQGDARCLQLIKLVDFYVFSLTDLNVSIPYFVTEWLDEDIEEVGELQDNFEAMFKLEVFRDTVKAISSLHKHDISHRDIKLDNFRVRPNDKMVVAVDYGTAVHIDNTPIQNPASYQAAGMRGITSPEALSGLAGVRDISFKGDLYSLGCILYKLFNANEYFTPVLSNQEIVRALTNINVALQFEEPQNKVEAWDKECIIWKNSIEMPSIISIENTVPKSIEVELEVLHRKLCAFDYKTRPKSIDEIYNKVDKCLNILKNQKRQVKIIEQRKLIRQRKIDKAIRAQKILEQRREKQTSRLEIKC
jgi:serine/threonine protein kinase